MTHVVKLYISMEEPLFWYLLKICWTCLSLDITQFVSSISILLPSFGLRSGSLISPKPSFFSLVNTFSIKSPFSPFIIFIYFTPYLHSWQIFIYYHLKYLIAILLTVHPFHTSNNNCSKPLAMIE